MQQRALLLVDFAMIIHARWMVSAPLQAQVVETRILIVVKSVQPQPQNQPIRLPHHVLGAVVV